MNLLLIITAVLFLFPVVSNGEVDWNSVPPKKVHLFYPGTTSWEYLTGPDHSTGANAVAKLEKTCKDCHIKEDRIEIFADDIITGKLRRKSRDTLFEPEPPKGIKGFIDLEVQAAYDSTNLYMKFKWSSPEGASFRKPTDVDRGYFDRIAVQLNSNLKSFSKTGCFMSCHDDVSYMPDAPSEEEITAHPFYAGQGRTDVRLYAYVTRNNSWSRLRPEQDLEKYLKAGAVIDLWIAGFMGREVITSDESIFYDRTRDSIKDVKADGNWDNGFYTVTIKRSLTTSDPMDIQLQEGKIFTIGIAVYDYKNGYRKHHVSFPLSVSVGRGEADITAVKTGEVKPLVK